MTHEPGIFELDDQAAITAVDARAMADVAARRVDPPLVVRGSFREWLA